MSWAVQVSRDGENVVTIEDRLLSGKPDITDDDADLIRRCAAHLIAFVGAPREPEPTCPGRDCQMCSGEYYARHFTSPCECDSAERHFVPSPQEPTP